MMEDIHDGAVCWSSSILPSGHNQLKKSSMPFEADKLRLERRFQSENGFFATWPNISSFIFSLEAIRI